MAKIMKNYIVFDNEGNTPDRYTIVDRESGDVFAAGQPTGETSVSGRYAGNCASHKISLYNAGWRQMPANKRIITAATEDYIHNAQLNPDWLGKELPINFWPVSLLNYINNLDKPQRAYLQLSDRIA